jgi:hypothetical protein
VSARAAALAREPTGASLWAGQNQRVAGHEIGMSLVVDVESIHNVLSQLNPGLPELLTIVDSISEEYPDNQKHDAPCCRLTDANEPRAKVGDLCESGESGARTQFLC